MYQVPFFFVAPNDAPNGPRQRSCCHPPHPVFLARYHPEAYDMFLSAIYDSIFAGKAGDTASNRKDFLINIGGLSQSSILLGTYLLRNPTAYPDLSRFLAVIDVHLRALLVRSPNVHTFHACLVG
jgi:hypothetical protein